MTRTEFDKLSHEQLKNQTTPYLAMVRSMKIGDRQIYPDAVLDNILDRTDYLPKGLMMQQRLDQRIGRLGDILGVEGTGVSDTLRMISEETRNKMADRLKGDHKTIFLVMVGPGGAGKDTVFDNAQEILSPEIDIKRPKKFTTRDSNRPGAGAYNFRDDIESLHVDIGDVPITSTEAERLKEKFGIETTDSLDLEMLRKIERAVESPESNLPEYNVEVDITGESPTLELIYRRSKGWYATRSEELSAEIHTGGVVAITGNPRNVARMMEWVKSNEQDVVTGMIYVFPPHPAQFVSAARTLQRDGVDQPTEQLLSATRQTEEVGILLELLEDGDLNKDDLVVIVNDKLTEDPAVTGNVKTQAGVELAELLQS